MEHATHLIIGAGGIGRATATALVELGHHPVVVTRSGTDLGLPGVASAAADASDSSALAKLADGAATIINAANPAKYHQWERDWPPIANALLAAAERSGAGLVTVSNLYLYGRVAAPMTPATAIRPNGSKGQVRADMWASALGAHESGRIKATELRASDYFGPGGGASVSLLNQYVIGPASKGKSVRLISGAPDVSHSWTYLPDIGRAVAALATDDRSWGRAWHVPSGDARSFREVAEDAARIAGQSVPKVAPLPMLLKKLLRVSPVVRELDETAHQFESPFVIDASDAATTFGLTATPWATALEATIDSMAG